MQNLSVLQVSLAVFSTYALISEEHTLDAETAFVALTYINLLNVPLSILPLGVFTIAQVGYSPRGNFNGPSSARFLWGA